MGVAIMLLTLQLVTPAYQIDRTERASTDMKETAATSQTERNASQTLRSTDFAVISLSSNLVSAGLITGVSLLIALSASVLIGKMVLRPA